MGGETIKNKKSKRTNERRITTKKQAQSSAHGIAVDVLTDLPIHSSFVNPEIGDLLPSSDAVPLRVVGRPIFDDIYMGNSEAVK